MPRSYEEIKKHSDSGKPSTGELLLAAGVTGRLGGITGNPADIVLVRMTSDSLRHPEKQYGYHHALTGLVSLVKNECIKGVRNLVRMRTVDKYRTC
ncbi:hypothetical protein JVT61DRAFT_9301 [Boletus reticuloceps]|uniref:Uncharacterized protein n=1 Tax=Boletus reticuloceps TaxID=495285 RepID=A0A8I2YGJ4_9AGAM|nr:hypothetical protein JVT61DRAFT_9301 [Boletus reticuloceps]